MAEIKCDLYSIEITLLIIVLVGIRKWLKSNVTAK